MSARAVALFSLVSALPASGCIENTTVLSPRDAGPAQADAATDAGAADADGDAGSPSDGGSSSVTCLACATSADCRGADCVQYGGSDYCAHTCTAPADCAPTEVCVTIVRFDGVEVQDCIPQSANCNGLPGCTACP